MAEHGRRSAQRLPKDQATLVCTLIANDGAKRRVLMAVPNAGFCTHQADAGSLVALDLHTNTKASPRRPSRNNCVGDP